MSIRSTAHLVSAAQLVPLAKAVAAAPGSSRIVFLDASWYLPNVPRSGETDFLASRIKLPKEAADSGARAVARFADIDAIKDKSSPYPHMLPTAPVFNKEIAPLGITRNDTVVVYDVVGNFSAPRMAWMLEIFNHPKTFLLDTFPDYAAQYGPDAVDSTSYPTLAAAYSSSSAAAADTFESPGFDARRVMLFEELRDIVTSPEQLAKHIILDARPSGRFTGAAPEPREGLSSGHAPGALSVPFSEVVDANNNNRFKDRDALRAVFAARGITPEITKEAAAGKNKQLVVMCGTGVTACALERALRIAELVPENAPVRVYDGSWTEWAQRAPKSLIIKDVPSPHA